MPNSLSPAARLAAMCLLLLGSITRTGATDAPTPSRLDPAQMEPVFDGFVSSLGLDLEHPIVVQDLSLKKDALELTLQKGTLYLAQPVAGAVTGAYFTGAGVMHLTPPGTMNRKSLKRDAPSPSPASRTRPAGRCPTSTNGTSS